MRSHSPDAIVLERRFDFSIERVFDAWLNPDDARRFLFVAPTGTITRAEIDPRVEGTFIITRRDARGDEIEHVGHYDEIDRPTRLAFTFGVPKFSLMVTRVIIDLQPLQSACALTLTHEGVPSEWSESAREGWKGILDGLAAHLANPTAVA